MTGHIEKVAWNDVSHYPTQTVRGTLVRSDDQTIATHACICDRILSLSLSLSHTFNDYSKNLLLYLYQLSVHFTTDGPF